MLGIIISILQMDSEGGVDEWTFVTAELEESLGHSKAVTVFCFLGGKIEYLPGWLNYCFLGEILI